jgi:V8-like Glu-specific endopeptidase
MGPLQVGGVNAGSAAVIHSYFYEATAKGVMHEYSTVLHANRWDADHSFFQGPGRTGHSGGGVYRYDGALIGVMCEADGPRYH